MYISALYVEKFYRVPSNLVETLLTCKNLEQVCWPTPKRWFLRPYQEGLFGKRVKPISGFLSHLDLFIKEYVFWLVSVC